MPSRHARGRDRRRDRRPPIAQPRLPPTSGRPLLRHWLVALVFAGAAAIVYGGGLAAPFMFDDELAIERNVELRSWPDVGRVLRSAAPESPLAGRPLVSLSFGLNYAATGPDPWGYRLVNLGVHVACALLLFGIVCRTLAASSPAAGASAPLAAASALLWLVHPLASEPVMYVTQRTEGLMALAALTTLYASIRATAAPRHRRWPMLAVAACAAGMACKETMVTVPVLVLVYDRVFTFRSWREAFGARGWFYGSLAACWLVLAALMVSSPRTIGSGFASSFASPWDYLLQQAMMITRYLRLTVWPDALVLYYGWASPASLAATWPYVVFVGLLAILTIVALRMRPALGFLGAWFFITLSPTSSIVPIASEVGAERRMYLPLAALAVLFVIGGWRIAGAWRARASVSQARSIPLVAAGLVLFVGVALAWRTHARTGEFASPLVMARTIYERWPAPATAHLLANELIGAGSRDEGIALLRTSAATFAPAHLELGVELFKAGNHREAIEHLRAFVRAEPNLTSAATAELLIGQALTNQRRFDDAIAHLQGVLARRPDDAVAMGLLADAHFARGAFTEAISGYEAFLAVDPNRPDALGNLAIAYVNTGQLDRALPAFRRAAELQPTNLQASLNLTRALLDRGHASDLAEASARADALAAAAPQEPAVHSLRGLALERQRQFAEARAAYERALALDPSHLPAREGLARLGR
jgi:tetratricopeptide (TPR) repeat protein